MFQQKKAYILKVWKLKQKRIKLYETNHCSFGYKLWCGLVYNLSEKLVDQIASLELTEWEIGPK